MIYIDDQLHRLTSAQVDEAIRRLPPQRRETTLRHRTDLGRRQSLLAYLLLCQALRLEHGIMEPPHFSFAEHGKPSLTHHPHLHFSLSHCPQGVACVLDTRPVGIDLEAPRPLRPGVLAYAMSPREQAEIEASPTPELLFTRLWTRKEALLKLSGQGIHRGMRDLLHHTPHRLQTTRHGSLFFSVAW